MLMWHLVEPPVVPLHNVTVIKLAVTFDNSNVRYNDESFFVICLFEEKV